MQDSITQQPGSADEQAPAPQDAGLRRFARRGAQAPGRGKPARSVSSGTLTTENRKLLEIVQDMQRERGFVLRRPRAR